MNLFKRPATHYGKVPEPETPYQKAAQVWDERIGSARVQAKNWRLMAFGSLILSAGFAGALVWQSARGTVVPWVVQVDNLGQAQTVAAATADYRPTDPQIAFHLGRFIEQVRSIPADPIIVRQNWLRAYEFTTDRGAVALNDHARAMDVDQALMWPTPDERVERGWKLISGWRRPKLRCIGSPARLPRRRASARMCPTAMNFYHPFLASPAEWIQA